MVSLTSNETLRDTRNAPFSRKMTLFLYSLFVNQKPCHLKFRLSLFFLSLDHSFRVALPISLRLIRIRGEALSPVLRILLL